MNYLAHSSNLLTRQAPCSWPHLTNVERGWENYRGSLSREVHVHLSSSPRWTTRRPASCASELWSEPDVLKYQKPMDKFSGTELKLGFAEMFIISGLTRQASWSWKHPFKDACLCFIFASETKLELSYLRVGKDHWKTKSSWDNLSAAHPGMQQLVGLLSKLSEGGIISPSGSKMAHMLVTLREIVSPGTPCGWLSWGIVSPPPPPFAH